MNPSVITLAAANAWAAGIAETSGWNRSPRRAFQPHPKRAAKNKARKAARKARRRNRK